MCTMDGESLHALHSNKVAGRHQKGSNEIIIPVAKPAPEANGTSEIRETIQSLEGESWFGSAYFEANETSILKTHSAAAQRYGDRPDNLKVFKIVFSEHAWAIKAE